MIFRFITRARPDPRTRSPAGGDGEPARTGRYTARAMAELFSGYSEFGRTLAGFLAREPTAHGGVLSDCEGDAVDYAFDPARTSELEVQILGAQVELAAWRVSAWTAARRLGGCEILIEASHGRLCCAFVDGNYVLAVVAGGITGDHELDTAAAERLLAGFRGLRREIEGLLRS